MLNKIKDLGQICVAFGCWQQLGYLPPISGVRSPVTAFTDTLWVLDTLFLSHAFLVQLSLTLWMLDIVALLTHWPTFNLSWLCYFPSSILFWGDTCGLLPLQQLLRWSFGGLFASWWCWVSSHFGLSPPSELSFNPTALNSCTKLFTTKVLYLAVSNFPSWASKNFDAQEEAECFRWLFFNSPVSKLDDWVWTLSPHDDNFLWAISLHDCSPSILDSNWNAWPKILGDCPRRKGPGHTLNVPKATTTTPGAFTE